MPKVIAVAGKGGVGKTTIGGMLVRYLLELIHNGPVLAVDADPNSNLNEVLGVNVNATIGQVRELMKMDVPAGMTKDVWVEYEIQKAVIEAKGFDLLVMGRPEGAGCYCAANSLAKQSIDALKKNYAYVIVDNEAGMEHMSRLVTQDVDILYIISDATPRGLLTASRIFGLIGELKLNILTTHILINGLKENDDGQLLRGIAAQKGMNVAGVVRDDREVRTKDAEGKSVFELTGSNLALADVYAIFEKTIRDPLNHNR
ncbi:MAG TPA: AAA family ATPase [Syntrophorhabdaceae bacterium]|nr:AAA family ATPase [Syntrophorhabdaceae bacterium]